MAYDRHPNSSQSQSSAVCLASSNSCLDGVPFKIGSAFRPPPRAILPPELMRRPQPCDALNEEYAYETEEAVLAWSRAREEAKLKAAAEREAAEKARAALAAAQSDSSSDSDEDIADNPVPQQSAASVVEESSTDPLQTDCVKPPWQLPLQTPAGSSILLPMPIQAQVKKIQSPAGAPRVDLAMFEQESDPFDNLELQTINDLEELRTVLDGSHIAGSSRENSPRIDQPTAEKTESVNDASQSAGQGAKQTSSSYVPWTLQKQEGGAGPVPQTMTSETEAKTGSDILDTVDNIDTANTVCQGQRNTRFTFDAASDGEYVQIRPDYPQQSVSYQKDSASVPVTGQSGGVSLASSNPSFPGNLPPQFASSKLFQSVLPPIVHPRSESLDVSSLSVKSQAPATNFATAQSAPVYQNASNFTPTPAAMSQSAYVVSSSSSNMPAYDMSKSDYSMSPGLYSNVPVTNLGQTAAASSSQGGLGSGRNVDSQNLYSRHRTYFPNVSSTPAVNGVETDTAVGMRNARSNPDLSLSREASQAQVLTSHSPQPWNPYKPLPPTPHTHSPDARSTSSSGSPSPDLRRSPASSGQTASPSTSTAVPAVPEVDPYNSLSHEAKAFVNNLTSMGFSRSRAARAVEKFGADEREVLDHLLNVDKLVEKKFKPELAETGLQLFRNDIKKAEQFLDLYYQFMELGFTGERIQTALVKHQLDRDKALDYLTT